MSWDFRLQSLLFQTLTPSHTSPSLAFTLLRDLQHHFIFHGSCATSLPRPTLHHASLTSAKHCTRRSLPPPRLSRAASLYALHLSLTRRTSLRCRASLLLVDVSNNQKHFFKLWIEPADRSIYSLAWQIEYEPKKIHFFIEQIYLVCLKCGFHGPDLKQTRLAHIPTPIHTIHTTQTPKTSRNHIKTMKMNTFMNFKKCS